jgi:hypothetical protein
MHWTFKLVRISLLVGVGSGAPSAAADIWLGDVVVSTPSDDAGGVVEYECTTAATASTGSASSDSGCAAALGSCACAA